MTRARLIITAITVQGLTQAEAARTYNTSEATVSRLMARYRTEGDAAYQPRSRRPRTPPAATPPATVELILSLRRKLTKAGLDAGAETIAWHLTHHHGIQLSRSTIHRILTRAQLIPPAPKKRPKSSYIRFTATQPNEMWQSDFTHYRLTTPEGRPGMDTEIITWLDDHSRTALHLSAHQRVTAPIVLATFISATDTYGRPASTLTDNGMVYTTRLAGGRGGKNALEVCLMRWGITQKNSQPGHPTTCGKVERFQQTLKKWLSTQPVQPATITELQALVECFREHYNQQRPHRSLAHRSTPATAYTARPKAGPGAAQKTHDRVRTDRIDKARVVTLRYDGRLHHIGIGRTYAGTYVLILAQDLQMRVINAATGEVLRELILDPTRDYQPTGRPKGPTRK